MCVMALLWPHDLTIHKDNLLLGFSQGTGSYVTCYINDCFKKTNIYCFLFFFVRIISAKSSTWDDLLIVDTVSHSFPFNVSISKASVYPNRQILQNFLTIVR